jgi:hypothetical protein
MRVRVCACMLASFLVVLVVVPAKGDDWPWISELFHPTTDPTTPNSLLQIARELDHVEDKIRDDGVVTTKQPDVWSQNSMTKYRKDFERQMFSSMDKFGFILSARVSRTDQASFSSQTALGASLTPLAPSSSGGGMRGRGGGASTAVTSPTTVIALPSASSVFSERDAQQQIANNLLNTPDPTINRNAPFSLFTGGKPFQDIGESAGKLGLEPNEFVNQKQSYLEHLNQLRRINLGADNADSAGYGLYLVRVPVSIQPGECTYKGHGAMMTVTAKHDFGARFLQETYQIFVVNDLVDILTPVVYEMIRSGYVEELFQREQFVIQKRAEIATKQRELVQKKAELDAKREQVAELVAGFQSLKPLLAKRGGEWSKAIADWTIGAIDNFVLDNMSEFWDPNAATKKFNEDPKRTQRAAALRETIEMILKMTELVPSDPKLQEIVSTLLTLAETLSNAENNLFSSDDMKKLSVARGKLDKSTGDLAKLIERGLGKNLTATPRGKSLLAKLDDILLDYFDRFFAPPGKDKSIHDNFPKKQKRAELSLHAP